MWDNSNHMLYLDHAATTPMRPAVWEAMEPFVADTFGNSSGSHGVSRRAKNALEEAREVLAGLIGARPQEIVFTSGGTEADNLAIKGPSLSSSGGGVVTTAIEHEAVLESAHFLAGLGRSVVEVPPEPSGLVDPDRFAAAISPGTAVASVMTANNETGAVLPVAAIVRVVRSVAPRAAIHTDAVQAFNSEDINVDDLEVDLLSLAAHKFGGPRGVGLLYVRAGTALEPVLHGGGQELGLRSGTHNVMGAVGMAVAAQLAVVDRSHFRARVGPERDVFEVRLGELVGAVRTIDGERLPQHAHLRFPNRINETMLIQLDQGGVAGSAGSACQSGAVTPSHVLTAMGMSASEAAECLRFSFGWTTEAGDGLKAAELVAGVLS